MDIRPAIVFQNVSFALGTGFRVFSNLSMEIPTGQRCVLFGASGSGISFFARLGLGLYRPSRGTIQVLGVDVSHLPLHELHLFRQRTGFLFRDARLIGNMSVERNIALPLNYHRTLRAETAHSRTEELLSLFGLESVREERPIGLTAEQRMFTALARSVAMVPEVLFFDDPLIGFSPDLSRRLLVGIDRLWEWIGRQRKEEEPPTLLVTVSHPAPFVGFADRFGVFREGKVAFGGDIPNDGQPALS